MIVGKREFRLNVVFVWGFIERYEAQSSLYCSVLQGFWTLITLARVQMSYFLFICIFLNLICDLLTCVMKRYGWIHVVIVNSAFHPVTRLYQLRPGTLCIKIMRHDCFQPKKRHKKAKTQTYEHQKTPTSKNTAKTETQSRNGYFLAAAARIWACKLQ